MHRLNRKVQAGARRRAVLQLDGANHPSVSVHLLECDFLLHQIETPEEPGGVELKLATLDTQPAPFLRPGVRTEEIVFRTMRRLGLRERLTRIAAGLQGAVNDVIKAEYFVNRDRSEIAALHRLAALRILAALWRALDIYSVEGLQLTRDRFSSSTFPMEHYRITRWPADLTE